MNARTESEPEAAAHLDGMELSATFVSLLDDLKEQFAAEVERAYQRGLVDGRAEHARSAAGRLASTIDDAVASASGAGLQAAFASSLAAAIAAGDAVDVWDYGVFYRASHVVRPDQPEAIRLEANRPLTDDEVDHLAHLAAYTYASTVRGEQVGAPDRDSATSFFFSADTSKSRRSDLDAALEKFEVDLDAYLLHGTPLRTTDRSGPGTRGTRAVDGLGDPGLRIAVFYDRVREA